VPALLFLLLGTVSVLWVRSPRHADLLGVFSPAGHLQGIASDRVGLLFFSSDVPFGREYGLTADVMSAPRENFGEVHDTLYNKPRQRWQFLGFRFSAGKLDLAGTLTCRYGALIVPYWFLVLVLLPLPARTFRAAWATWRRKRKGLCVGCGYDIRASTGRCPECGEEIPKAKPAKPASVPTC
jgi:predicted RNA-binding Zn-ribbon protein involved in translation (DUF1610 family)